MVASCRGDLSFRRTARKATPIRLGDQAPGHVGWGRVGPAYICSAAKLTIFAQPLKKLKFAIHWGRLADTEAGFVHHPHSHILRPSKWGFRCKMPSGL